MAGRRGERAAESHPGLSFGTVADQYDRYRLTYPDELVDAVAQYAARPLCTALEVGAGTGKATRLFASRGVAVTALEPDAQMASVFRRATRGLATEVVLTTFEQFETAHRFDLVYAAAAWHWTDPASRWARAAGLLAPGGVLALFGQPAEIKDPELFAIVDEVEKQLLPDGDPATVRAWSVAEMAAADGLTDVVQRDLPAVVSMTATDFVHRLATVSAYLALSPGARATALRRVRAALPDRLDVDATVHLALARRA